MRHCGHSQLWTTLDYFHHHLMGVGGNRRQPDSNALTVGCKWYMHTLTKRRRRLFDNPCNCWKVNVANYSGKWAFAVYNSLGFWECHGSLCEKDDN